jgi:fumarate reductase subunit C
MSTTKTPTKTKEYIRPMPATWWLHNRYVAMFMVRELTSIFVGGYAIFLLILLIKANRGEESFGELFAGTLLSPASVILHLITLAFVIYHSITSFNAAPEIMVVQRGEERVDPQIIVAVNYVLWLFVSLVILLLVLFVPV